MLNQPRYQGASILVARENFGCGSSREHAPWALLRVRLPGGHRAVFADIFYNNCFKNGLLPIVLEPKIVDRLFREAVAHARLSSSRSTSSSRRVATPDGESFTFDIDPFRKQCLLNGCDDIGLTLRHADEIRAFERSASAQPWLFLTANSRGCSRP